MGKTPTPKTKAKRIVDIGRRGLKTAEALGGDIAEMAVKRLKAPLARHEAAAGAYGAASEKLETARTAVATADQRSKDGVRTMKDEAYNLLGRPKRDVQMDELFPDGVQAYLPTQPADQPVCMMVLITRIAGSSSRAFTDQQRKEWGDQLEGLRGVEVAALTELEPLALVAEVTRSELKTSVAAIRTGLLSFKRDLQASGMSEAQIHEIIPSASEPSTPAKPADGGGSGGPANNNGGGTAAA